MNTHASPTWDATRLPDQSGRTFLITGANAGLGFFASEQLARAGAHVILSGRSPHRLAAAHDALEARVPDAAVETLLLDVSNPGSVRAAAASVRGGLFRRGRLDGVLLNAGMVHTPRQRETTRDGRELVFATNALGHFVLAAELLTALSKSSSTNWTTRMVWLGSMSTRLRGSDPVDLQLESGYRAWRAYVQSKVVVEAIGFEADLRLRDAGVPVESIVAHPGFSRGGLSPIVTGVNRPSGWKRFVDGLQAPVAQSKARGAEPLVRALVDPDARGGDYWGPRHTLKGAPIRQRPASVSTDPEVRRRVWESCEHLSGLEWPFARALRVAGR